MGQRLLLGILLLIGVLVSGCTKHLELKDVIRTEQGHFRGVSIDDSPEMVMAIEDSTKLADRNRTDTYLYYDFPLKKKSEIKGANSLTVAYNFEDGKLFEIQADIYLEDIGDCNHIYEQLIELFNRKYGDYVTDEGYLVWKTQLSGGDKISVELINETSEYKVGKLSLTIFNDDY